MKHLIDICGGDQLVGIAATAGPDEEVGPGSFVRGRDKHFVVAALNGESAAIPDRHHRYCVGELDDRQMVFRGFDTDDHLRIRFLGLQLLRH